jgi:hypothetical protein
MKFAFDAAGNVVGVVDEGRIRGVVGVEYDEHCRPLSFEAAGSPTGWFRLCQLHRAPRRRTVAIYVEDHEFDSLIPNQEAGN